jgi:hypothetical protein
VPPLFTVYMKGSTTPYDWSSGPVPPAQLPNIERITVQVTAPSGKPDWRGRYAESHFRTEVNSLRNTPNFGDTEYGVDGFVYHDLDQDRVRDPGEPGLSGAVLKLGALTTSSSSTGYFMFAASAGTYWLQQLTPPTGYVDFSSPESVSVTVPPPTTRSFPCIALQGGMVHVFVFDDLDGDGIHDMGEPGKEGVQVTYSPSGDVQWTGTTGYDSLFTAVGGYTVAVAAPDSFTVTTTNPVSGTMTDGGSASHSFGVQEVPLGTVTGKVFRDNNRNRVLDGGEAGIQNVWVGVTPDGGMTVSGYAYTNASGDYSIDVPINDPPHTTPYTILCIPPTGFFPTSSTAIHDIWLQDGQTLADNNFGMAAFVVITLEANRVLCLASADVIEKDWPGSATHKARGDRDIVLGSDTGGSDQVSAWFNQYTSTPLYDATPTYTRSAPNAVLAMAMDALDKNTPFAQRPDLVTGTKITASGNFFVWFTQGSSGNQGYFPTTFSPGQNYKTMDQGDVQALVTLDCAGGSGADMPDIVVGTKSPTANQGTIEVWRSNNATTPTFTREEVYPTAGGTPAGGVGEVTSLAVGDLDGDGTSDLVAGTRTGDYSGQVLFFRGANKGSTPHFTYEYCTTLASDAVTAVALVDVDGDAILDVVAGTQTGTSSGQLIFLRSRIPGTFLFDAVKALNAPGIVTSLVCADFGGSTRKDIALGFRQSTTSYAGGLRIYYLDALGLWGGAVDPSSGSLVNFVPALTSNHFNYGIYPLASPPYLPDLAAGVKFSATTGAVVVFIR